MAEIGLEGARATSTGTYPYGLGQPDFTYVSAGFAVSRKLRGRSIRLIPHFGGIGRKRPQHSPPKLLRPFVCRRPTKHGRAKARPGARNRRAIASTIWFMNGLL